MLGWAAFPALLIGLLFQALLFGHGGISVLGVNTLSIAAPAVAAGWLFRRRVGYATPPHRAALMAGLGTGMCVAATALFSASVLALSGREWLRTAQTLLVAHVFVMAGEALLAYFIVAYLLRVRPALLLGERSGP
jgi:cobalt/nickel transport system permease protein